MSYPHTELWMFWYLLGAFQVLILLILLIPFPRFRIEFSINKAKSITEERIQSLVRSSDHELSGRFVRIFVFQAKKAFFQTRYYRSS